MLERARQRSVRAALIAVARLVSSQPSRQPPAAGATAAYQTAFTRGDVTLTSRATQADARAAGLGLH